MNKSGCETDYAGTKRWYRNGRLHREDGPAVEYWNGDRDWFRNGLCHREGGPASEFASGAKHWYRNDFLHREDGPAVEWADGGNQWYLNGKLVSELSGQPCDTQEQFEALMRTRAFW